MKRLYRVEAHYYVMAGGELEAVLIRPDVDCCPRLAEAVSNVDSEWYDAIPFGGDDDRTCGEILQQQNEEL